MPTPLRISENRRFLIRATGEPFFFLGDTAWELFHRLSFEEADHYLQTRARQGFTVIQAVILAELNGLRTPNANGDLPLIDEDPTRPNEPYFAHVDRVVARANELGLVVALLPTWGDKWNAKWGSGPMIFTPENAREYGRILGERYREADLIWMLGGDRLFETEEHVAITRAMAEGIREADGGEHLITVHPQGAHSSSETLHSEPWLDFNTLQSGHHRVDGINWQMIAHDYALLPTKPCMDSESPYEDHPIDWKPDTLGFFNSVQVRRPSYWGVFAGGHGLTYGHHAVWQMLAEGREPVGLARGDWRSALEFPVANQMVHIKKLMLSRPFLSRIPAPDMIVGENPAGSEHLEATRDAEGRYAFVYFPGPVEAELDLRGFTGEHLIASWFDVRTGESVGAETIVRMPTARFSPPSTPEAPDWVLVLDDPSAARPIG